MVDVSWVDVSFFKVRWGLFVTGVADCAIRSIPQEAEDDTVLQLRSLMGTRMCLNICGTAVL